MPTAPHTPTWSELTHLDHDKAWNVLRRLDRSDLLLLLARALKSVPANKLESIFAEHAHPHEIGDLVGREPKPLRPAVLEFAEAALRGEFYEDFMVNSHNCTDKSRGTHNFEAQLDLLFDRCVAEAETGNPAEVSAAYELLLDLLREIDRFERDIVFFADEGGTWQFHVNWKRILPGYFRCLAKAIGPGEFEDRANAVIAEFVDVFDREHLRRVLAQEAEALSSGTTPR